MLVTCQFQFHTSKADLIELKCLTSLSFGFDVSKSIQFNQGTFITWAYIISVDSIDNQMGFTVESSNESEQSMWKVFPIK